MKKIAIIGASYLQLPLVQKAEEMGLYTICFAWNDGAICKKKCNKFYPISILEKELILEKCIAEKIEAVISIASDVAVPTINYIAYKLGLVGNTIICSKLSTNKFLMRKAFKNVGLLIPRYLLIRSLEEIYKIEKLKFPVVIKPVDRSGSKGVTVLKNSDNLKGAVLYALDQSFSKKVIVEEFIIGKEISVEVISWRGEHHVLAYTDKVTSGFPHFVELEHHQPSEIARGNLKKQIEDSVVKGLDSLGIKNGASHSEFIITENDDIYITEIGARMGGDFIGSNLVELSTGYDFLKGTINVSMGNFIKPEKIFNKCSGIFFYSSQTSYIKEVIQTGRQDIIRSGLEELKCNDLRESSDRTGYFIYQSNSKITVK